MPFMCSQCRTGPTRVVTLHVMLPTCCWVSFILRVPSCLSVGLQRPSVCLSVCRNGADINAATLQTCRKRRRYYLCLVLSLLTQSGLYCYQREFFHYRPARPPKHNTADIAQGAENFIHIHSLAQKCLNQKQM